MNTSDTIVISLGGSIVVPEAIDITFLHAFRALIEKHTNQGKRFIIIVGGGNTAREYINALEDNGNIDDTRKDWMGIYTTRLNAQFVKIFFGDLAHKEIIHNPNELFESRHPVIFGGGWEPGASTDHVAVVVAGNAKATKVINLSNIAHVYDSDPNKNPDAIKYERLTWDQYRSFIPREWTPGLSTPFDPIASVKASELGIEVAIMDGKNIENLDRYLDGQAFQGTIIA